MEGSFCILRFCFGTCFLCGETSFSFLKIKMLEEGGTGRQEDLLPPSQSYVEYIHFPKVMYSSTPLFGICIPKFAPIATEHVNRLL